jgi:hypothetical protein
MTIQLPIDADDDLMTSRAVTRLGRGTEGSSRYRRRRQREGRLLYSISHGVSANVRHSAMGRAQRADSPAGRVFRSSKRADPRSELYDIISLECWSSCDFSRFIFRVRSRPDSAKAIELLQRVTWGRMVDQEVRLRSHAHLSHSTITCTRHEIRRCTIRRPAHVPRCP